MAENEVIPIDVIPPEDAEPPKETQPRGDITKRQENAQALREFCRNRRAELKLSLSEVAHRAGFGKGTYGTFEAGRDSIPGPETLKKLAKGLGVPYTTLALLAAGVSPYSVTASPFEAMVAEMDEDTRETILKILNLPPNHRRVALAAAEATAQALHRRPTP